MLRPGDRMTRFNNWLAVKITNGTGTMWCAYLFALLAIYGHPGKGATAHDWVQWVSQTFIQLVMLSILAVAQKAVADKHTDLHAKVDELHVKHDLLHEKVGRGRR